MFQTLFESDHISIQTLWVFVVIALLLSSWLAVQRLKRRRVNFNLFIRHSTAFLFSAIFFSRTVYFVTHPTSYFPAFDLRTVWNFVSIWDQGFSFWGAFFGLIIILIYRIKKESESIWKWFDALSVPVLVGLMIGEIGAFLGGYAYGKPTDLPWGISYETFTVKYTTAIHPTQLYAFILIGLLLWSKLKLKNKTKFFETDGNTTVYLATGYCVIASLLEITRGDDTLMILGLRLPLILFLIATIGFCYLLYRRHNAFNSKTNESIKTN